jgi:hypothetical protein
VTIAVSDLPSSRDAPPKALEGDYRAEHLFALKQSQSLAGYR